MGQKSKISFALAKSLMVTGAITECCREVEVEICKHIKRDESTIVVEFGMGQGNITREILKTMSPTSKLYAFEVKESFCNDVRETIGDDRLIIINDGAENLKKYISGSVDAIVSTVPLSFFNKDKRLAIIQSAHDVLENGSCYSQVSYSKLNLKIIREIFEEYEIASYKNLMTEYVFHCKKVNL